MNIVNTKEMIRLEAIAIEAGISSFELMENAGRSVAEFIAQKENPHNLVILICCGGSDEALR